MFLLPSSTGIEAHWNQGITSQPLWKCGPNMLPWFLYPTSIFEYLLCARSCARQRRFSMEQDRKGLYCLGRPSGWFQSSSSVQFSHSVMSDSLQPHGLQHARPPCPLPALGVYSNPCPSSQWCHPNISSCRPLLPPSIFPSIRVFSNESALSIRWPKCWSVNFSISPSNEYSGMISLPSKELSRVFSNTTLQK